MNFELVLLLFCIVTWLCLIKDYRCSLCGACLSYLSVNNVFFSSFVCINSVVVGTRSRVTGRRGFRLQLKYCAR